MQPKHQKVIAVVGSSAPSPGTVQLAFDVGKTAVLRGYSIVSGGMSGIMEAASRGAQQGKDELLQQAGAAAHLPQVIAILPMAEKSAANPYVDVVIPTGLGYTRNALVVLAGDGVIALEGGSGTLSEVAYAWQFFKPVAAMQKSGGWAQKLAGQSLDEKRGDLVFSADTADEAVDYIAKHIGPAR